MLEATSIKTGTAKFIETIPRLKRFGSERYSTGSPVMPDRWSDEEKFYDWLVEEGLPRQLAEFLYLHAPEVTFMAGSGYIDGVEAIISKNSDPGNANVREAGYFIVGSGPNGDSLVIDVDPGQVAFLPVELQFQKTAEELRELFIPISSSIGEYIWRWDRGEDLPGDYWAAKKRIR